jgi:hypothetical protein
MSDEIPLQHDLTFGAKVHDPAYWRAHLLVAEVETHFDGPHGWVGLKLKQEPVAGAHLNPATPTAAQATRDDPDLYFYGEGECPLSLFEHAPRVRELRVAIEGPVDGDDRHCWSVGIWLTEPMH